jgi:hypothetical protein
MTSLFLMSFVEWASVGSLKPHFEEKAPGKTSVFKYQVHDFIWIIKWGWGKPSLISCLLSDFIGHAIVHCSTGKSVKFFSSQRVEWTPPIEIQHPQRLCHFCIGEGGSWRNTSQVFLAVLRWSSTTQKRALHGVTAVSILGI